MGFFWLKNPIGSFSASLGVQYAKNSLFFVEFQNQPGTLNLRDLGIFSNDDLHFLTITMKANYLIF